MAAHPPDGCPALGAKLKCQLSHAGLSHLLVAESWTTLANMLREQDTNPLAVEMLRLGAQDPVSRHAQASQRTGACTLHCWRPSVCNHCAACSARMLAVSFLIVHSSTHCRTSRATRPTICSRALPSKLSSSSLMQSQLPRAVLVLAVFPMTSSKRTRTNAYAPALHIKFCPSALVSAAIVQPP